MDQSEIRAAARERLTLGWWLTMIGAAVGFVAVFIPARSGEFITEESVIESGPLAALTLLPIVLAGGIGIALWCWLRGIAWPNIVVGLWVLLVGVILAVPGDDDSTAEAGSWLLVFAGALIFVGGILMTMGVRRARIELAVLERVGTRGSDTLPAPVAALPPEGWYPDPRDAAKSRWWDGSRWTDATRHGASEPATMPPPV